MKQKLIFSAIIAAIFIAAMIIYKDSLTFTEMAACFVGSASTILAIWKWISQVETDKQNVVLKRVLENETGETFEEMKSRGEI